jgi:hypothetical protein
MREEKPDRRRNVLRTADPAAWDRFQNLLLLGLLGGNVSLIDLNQTGAIALTRIPFGPNSCASYLVVSAARRPGTPLITGSDYLMDVGATAAYWYGDLTPKRASRCVPRDSHVGFGHYPTQAWRARDSTRRQQADITLRVCLPVTALGSLIGDRKFPVTSCRGPLQKCRILRGK